MSIQVRTSEPAWAAKPAEQETKTASAPEASASEQKETTESETVDEAESTEDESDAEDAEDKSTESEKEKPKKQKGGFQRRIDKLNARVAERERELDYWRNLAAKNGAGETKTEKVETKSEDPSKPKAGNYDTHAEYVEALTDWKIEQREKAKDEKEKVSKVQSEQETLFKSHAERVKAFAEKHDDFMDVIADADDVPVSPAIREIILSSENGPALMYELAKNREEYERICSLSPLAAAREMGKIESRLQASDPKKVETKKITNAPKPIEPVGKGNAGAVRKSIYDQELSQSEYEKLRREQMRRKA